MRNFYFMEVISLKENMRACSICGSLHPVEELTEFDDHYLCRDCLHTETTLCERCGESACLHLGVVCDYLLGNMIAA